MGRQRLPYGAAAFDGCGLIPPALHVDTLTINHGAAFIKPRGRMKGAPWAGQLVEHKATIGKVANLHNSLASEVVAPARNAHLALPAIIINERGGVGVASVEIPEPLFFRIEGLWPESAF